MYRVETNNDKFTPSRVLCSHGSNKKAQETIAKSDVVVAVVESIVAI